MSSEALVLLLFFNIKHLLGDFVFQTAYMAFGKGQSGWEFVQPLSFHCLVHAMLSAGVICLFLDLKFLWFAPIEFAAHFIIDRLKSGSRYGGRFSMIENPRMFWALFGLDQFAHQLTYILFISFALY